MSETGLAPEAYAAGLVATIAVVALLGWGAWRVRRALLPGWSGPQARLAEVVLALYGLVLTAWMLGSLGAFSRGWVFLGTSALGVGAATLAGRAGLAERPGCEPAPAPAPVPRREIAAAAVGVVIVAAVWAAWVAHSLGGGMTHVDTLWQHGPYSARFLQAGHFSALDGITVELSSYYPQTSELLHALVAMPFGSDLLSPLFNAGWATLGLLAAFCAGRRNGTGPLCVLGAALVLGLPAVVGSQAGQASTDLAPAVLLMAAVALLLEGDLEPAPLAVAALAAGLALSTKLIVAAPLAALTILLLARAWRARQVAAAAIWVLGLAASGTFWLARNWVRAGNPLPFFGLDFGPISLPRRVDVSGGALVDFLEASLWRGAYLPSLRLGFGRLWPFVLAPMVVASATLVVSRRAVRERPVAAAVLVGFAAWCFTPLTGSVGFAVGLRYLTPVLLVASVVALRDLGEVRRAWRPAVPASLLVLIVVDAVPAGVKAFPWPDRGTAAGLSAVTVAAGLAWLFDRVRRRADSARFLAVFAVCLFVAAATVGWWSQKYYFSHRYLHPGLEVDAAYAYFRTVDHARVAVMGTGAYPAFGLDLSNDVVEVDVAAPEAETGLCRAWREALSGFEFVLYTPMKRPWAPVPPPPEVLSSDSSLELVAREGIASVYRVTGPLHPGKCI